MIKFYTIYESDIPYIEFEEKESELTLQQMKSAQVINMYNTPPIINWIVYNNK